MRCLGAGESAPVCFTSRLSQKDDKETQRQKQFVPTLIYNVIFLPRKWRKKRSFLLKCLCKQNDVAAGIYQPHKTAPGLFCFRRVQNWTGDGRICVFPAQGQPAGEGQGSRSLLRGRALRTMTLCRRALLRLLAASGAPLLNQKSTKGQTFFLLLQTEAVFIAG